MVGGKQCSPVLTSKKGFLAWRLEPGVGFHPERQLQLTGEQIRLAGTFEGVAETAQ
jgi:hypothetical protein